MIQVEFLNQNIRDDMVKLKGNELGLSWKVKERRMKSRGQKSKNLFTTVVVAATAAWLP